MFMPYRPEGQGVVSTTFEPVGPVDSNGGERVCCLVEPAPDGLPRKTPALASEGPKTVIHLRAELKSPKASSSCAVPDSGKVITHKTCGGGAGGECVK